MRQHQRVMHQHQRVMHQRQQATRMRPLATPTPLLGMPMPQPGTPLRLQAMLALLLATVHPLLGTHRLQDTLQHQGRYLRKSRRL